MAHATDQDRDRWILDLTCLEVTEVWELFVAYRMRFEVPDDPAARLFLLYALYRNLRAWNALQEEAAMASPAPIRRHETQSAPFFEGVPPAEAKEGEPKGETHE